MGVTHHSSVVSKARKGEAKCLKCIERAAEIKMKSFNTDSTELADNCMGVAVEGNLKVFN
jgi:hypothetical protein